MPRIILFFFLFFSILNRQDSFSYGQSTGLTKNYNVILIVLDSVRADHLSCYGYKRNTSPAIDKFASEGLLFEQAIAQSIWSLPSQCSILTSKYVPSHGVENLERKLSDSELTLAEILRMYGYKTAAFTGGFWVNSVFNVGQGFDVYRDELLFAKIKDTSAQALEWLKSNKNDKFFMFLQGFDGHSPFNLPKQYEELYAKPGYDGIFKTVTLDHRIGDRLFGHTFFLDYEYKKKINVADKDIDYIIAHYDGSISYADSAIGEFLKQVDDLGLKDNTIVIFTSYHGTPLFEHGIILRRQHGGPTEGTIHVPLIIRHPQIPEKGMRLDPQAQLIDIMPTILDFLGIPINHQAQGRSLVTLIKGTAGPDFNKYVYINGFKEKAVRTTRWKLIEREADGERLELYCLKKDPHEQENLAEKERGIVFHLKQILNSWFRGQKLQDSEKSNAVDNHEIEKIKDEMKNAGYWFLDLPHGKEVIGRQVPQSLKLIVNEK